MALINPDLKFIEDVKAAGGENIKKCYQCATCSVVCNLSPDDKPYPRKEMIYTQWGLKDKLMGDPDVWLCHWCNDCSVHCPRGVKPGDVMAAIRSNLIQNYTVPSFLGKMLGSVKFLPLLLLFPIVLLAVLIGAFNELKEGAPVLYSDYFPHIPLQVFFTLATGLAALGALVGVSRFWNALNVNSSKATVSLVGAAITFIKDLLFHSWFRSCGTSSARSTAHLLIFYGFASLFVATSGAVYCAYISHTYPLELWHPVKIIGNIGAILLTLGCFWVVAYRFLTPEKVGGGSYSDWIFVTTLGLVSLTGIVAEFARYGNVAGLAYPIYFIHLVLVFFLLVYAPYSKFAHFIYRTVAMVHAGMRGRTKKKSNKVFFKETNNNL